MAKLKLALYWATSCGGCEISVLQIGEKVLTLVEVADIVFWPVALDYKYKDVEAMEDGSIDLCLFNGAIRNDENEHMAKLLRQKSKILIAYGSCSHEGCIPGLANMYTKDQMFNFIYKDSPSTENPEGITPQTSHKVPEGELTLPNFWNTVKKLNDVVDVDYYVPGCPPESQTTWAALEAVIKGELPEKGSVIGASIKANCDECERVIEEKKVKKFYRPHEIKIDREKCILEQGVICMGPATRAGCGLPCVKYGNMPCRGCYGPPPHVKDQGAKMLSAVASIIDSNDPEEIAEIAKQVVDPVGTFYRFSLPDSLLRRSRNE